MNRNAIDILTWGAAGDGVVSDTKIIQQAIDEAAQQKQSVIFPAGVYLVGSLFLREKSHLVFEEGAVLKGTTAINEYPEIPTRIAGVEMKWPAAILNAIQVKEVTIEGPGLIDGQGEYWWELYWGKDSKSGLRSTYDQQGKRWVADYLIKRPRACLIYEAESITLKDLTFRRSGFWNLQVTYTKDVLIESVTIRDNHGPSTDGIDIDSSENVRITGCHLECGDDCIAIKSGRDGDGARVDRPSKNIEIDHCQITGGYGITLGSEVSAGVSRIHIHDIEFTGADCGIRMKSSKERGGFIKDVIAENLTMTDVQFPFSWIMDWHNAYNRKVISDRENLTDIERAVAKQIPEELQMTKVQNIEIKNVQAKMSSDYSLPSRAFDLVAFSEKPMENILFENCKIIAKEFGRMIGVDKLLLKDVDLTIFDENEQSNDSFDNR